VHGRSAPSVQDEPRPESPRVQGDAGRPSPGAARRRQSFADGPLTRAPTRLTSHAMTLSSTGQEPEAAVRNQVCGAGERRRGAAGSGCGGPGAGVPPCGTSAVPVPVGGRVRRTVLRLFAPAQGLAKPKGCSSHPRPLRCGGPCATPSVRSARPSSIRPR